MEQRIGFQSLIVDRTPGDLSPRSTRNIPCLTRIPVVRGLEQGASFSSFSTIWLLPLVDTVITVPLAWFPTDPVLAAWLPAKT
jgi:hypothetical protein